jgi:putative Holliday junction resolvase
MAIDLGKKNIGVAVSDQLGWTAQGLDTIKSTGKITGDLDKIKELVEKYEVERIVVGLPRNMNGTIGPQGQKALDFAARAARHLNLPVDTWDERLSTAAAERLLINADVSRVKRRKVVDKMAASIILQDYLNARVKKT